MSFVIASQAEKGGNGKSTVAVNLAAALAGLGYRTLLADVDWQGTISRLYLKDTSVLPHTVHDIFSASITPLSELIQPTGYDRLSIIPSDRRLKPFDSSHGYEEASDVFLLQDSIAELDDDFDFVIIDTPPRDHLTAFSALVAADLVLVPVKPEGFSIDSLMDFQNQLHVVRQTKNPSLHVRYLINDIDYRWSAHRKIRDKLRDHFETEVVCTVELRRYAVLVNAAIAGVPITVFDPTSAAAAEIQQLAKELVEQFARKPIKVDNERNAISHAA